MSVDFDSLTDTILARCEVLALCSDEPDRLTRTFLRPSVHRAHDLLTGWMRQAGLEVRRDAIGNLFGRAGRLGPAEASVFIVGSHIDTVPDAGKYDGVLGVLLGIAAAESLQGRTFRRALDVVAFSEEEGIRYKTPYLGSRAVCGRLDPAMLEIQDADGVTLEQAIRDFGLKPDEVAVAAYAPGQGAGYFEPHIEQGPILEALNISLGVVEAIAGQSRVWLHFIGRSGHAGTLPMELRRDALCAGSEFVSEVERVARKTEGLRATVGSFMIAPGAVNVVPGSVLLSLDVRHATDEVRTKIVGELFEKARSISGERKLELEINPAANIGSKSLRSASWRSCDS